MRNSKTCSKCQSTDIVRIPGQARAHGGGNNIAYGITNFSAIKVTRYLCASCGFIEEWLDSPDDIAKAAVYLASEDSSWVSGETLMVGGGARL